MISMPPSPPPLHQHLHSTAPSLSVPQELYDEQRREQRQMAQPPWAGWLSVVRAYRRRPRRRRQRPQGREGGEEEEQGRQWWEDDKPEDW